MPAKGQDLMANSVYLAKLIGPVVLAIAIGLFVNAKHYRSMAEEGLRSGALIYMSGVLALTAGLAVVLAHNVWAADWRILITLIGWLALIGGAVRIIHPQTSQDMGRWFLKHPQGLTIAGAVWGIVGLILCFFGYFR